MAATSVLAEPSDISRKGLNGFASLHVSRLKRSSSRREGLKCSRVGQHGTAAITTLCNQSAAFLPFSPDTPGWFHNLVADPHASIQDGEAPHDFTVETVDGDERQSWWDRAVDIYPPYAEYQDKTDRTIPVFVARPVTA